jgi:hypothetical protein
VPTASAPPPVGNRIERARLWSPPRPSVPHDVNGAAVRTFQVEGDRPGEHIRPVKGNKRCWHHSREINMLVLAR